MSERSRGWVARGTGGRGVDEWGWVGGKGGVLMGRGGGVLGEVFIAGVLVAARGGVGWDGVGWDGVGWDGMGWDGMGWGGMGWGGVGLPP